MTPVCRMPTVVRNCELLLGIYVENRASLDLRRASVGPSAAYAMMPSFSGTGTVPLHEFGVQCASYHYCIHADIALVLTYQTERFQPTNRRNTTGHTRTDVAQAPKRQLPPTTIAPPKSSLILACSRTRGNIGETRQGSCRSWRYPQHATEHNLCVATERKECQ